MPTPALHITEAFAPTASADEAVYSEAVKNESNQNQQPLSNPVDSTAAVTSGGLALQTLERQPRKLSSTSSATSMSRPSTAASKAMSQPSSSSRSRSCSKERLLSSLSGSENATQTSYDEDEIEG